MRGGAVVGTADSGVDGTVGVKVAGVSGVVQECAVVCGGVGGDGAAEDGWVPKCSSDQKVKVGESRGIRGS